MASTETDQTHRPGICDPRLRTSSETELWEIARRGDSVAREELVRRYMPFAQRLAARFQNRHESSDDLDQVASLGLVNAVNRFDPDHGSSFPSFAAPTIKGELKRYFRDRVWLIRVPRGLQEEMSAVDNAVSELSSQLHREPTPEEIDDFVDLEPGAYERAASARKGRIPVSLDAHVFDSQDEFGERIGGEDPSFRVLEDTDELREAIGTLGDTERLVMRLRFIEDLTQSEIADRLGCSQMHISRMLRRSIAAVLEKVSPDES